MPMHAAKIFLVLVGFTAAALAQEWVLVDLGEDVYPAALSDDTLIGGTVGPLGARKMFLWRDGALTIIQPKSWEGGTVADIAADGTVVGQAVLSDPDLPTRPYVLRGGTFTFIDAETSIGAAAAVNAAGMVGGFLQDRLGSGFSDSLPFVVVDGTLKRLGAGLGGGIEGINESGVAVGSSGGQAIRWERGTTTVLPGLGTAYTTASDVNAAGTIVGTSASGTPSWVEKSWAVKWVDGEVRDIGTIDGQRFGWAYSINDAGDVVGLFNTGSLVVAFLEKNGSLQLLDDLAGPSTGWRFWTAQRINNKGEIVGIGVPPGGSAFHGYLLEPVEVSPEAMLEALRAKLASLGLPRGIQQSLDAKLRAATDAIARGDVAAACNQLAAFLRELGALEGKKVNSAEAAELEDAVRAIRAAMDC